MKEIQFGRHIIVEDDACLRIRISGDLHPDEASQMLANIESHRSQYGAATINIVNISDLGAFPPETRKVFGAQKGVVMPPTAMIGGSFAQRTLIGLMKRLLSLVTSAPIDLRFFDDEESAQTWLEEQRAKRR